MSNFFELIVLDLLPTHPLASPTTISDLQWILDTPSSGPGAITFQFRRSTSPSHPDRLLFIGAWDSIANHDELDLNGTTPKVLKLLFSRFQVGSAYFFYLDAAKVDLMKEEIGVEAWNVREGKRGDFSEAMRAAGAGAAGGWYVTKKVPPLPRVMPTDEAELRMIEEGRKRAEARLEENTPNIWISFSDGDKDGGFAKEVEAIVDTVESDCYKIFLVGSAHGTQ